VRGDPIFRLLPPAQAADPRDPHLRHVRPPDAPPRRPRGLQFRRPGTERGADHLFRDRESDALLLLCGRPRQVRDGDDGPGRDRGGGETVQPGGVTVVEWQRW